MSSERKDMPAWLRFAIVIAVVASWIPLAIVARERFTTSEKPPLHLFFDMDNQPSFKAQSATPVLADGTPLFDDGRVMRPQVDGTIARGGLAQDAHYERGVAGGKPAERFPAAIEFTRELVERGRERFEISCSPCHGLAGYGDGLVARRADELKEGTWTPPMNLHDEVALKRPVGHIFQTISNGIRTMPAYGRQIDVEDRWAIVAYVKALQKSQAASVGDVPEELRGQLE